MALGVWYWIKGSVRVSFTRALEGWEILLENRRGRYLGVLNHPVTSQPSFDERSVAGGPVLVKFVRCNCGLAITHDREA